MSCWRLPVAGRGVYHAGRAAAGRCGRAGPAGGRPRCRALHQRFPAPGLKELQAPRCACGRCGGLQGCSPEQHCGVLCRRRPSGRATVPGTGTACWLFKSDKLIAPAGFSTGLHTPAAPAGQQDLLLQPAGGVVRNKSATMYYKLIGFARLSSTALYCCTASFNYSV